MKNLESSKEDLLHGCKPGLIIYMYIDTKEKCRHLKKFTCKGTFRQVLKLFIRVIAVAPLTFSLVQLSPPSPISFVNTYTTHLSDR
jgi:hypothetical protein